MRGSKTVLLVAGVVLAVCQGALGEEAAPGGLTAEAVLERFLEVTADWEEVEIEFVEVWGNRVFGEEKRGKGRFSMSGPKQGEIVRLGHRGGEDRLVWSPAGLQAKLDGDPEELLTYEQLKVARENLRNPPEKIGFFPALILAAQSWYGIFPSPRDCFPLLLVENAEVFGEQFGDLRLHEHEYVILVVRPKDCVLSRNYSRLAIVLDRATFVPMGTKHFASGGNESTTRLFTALRVNGEEVTVPWRAVEEGEE